MNKRSLEAINKQFKSLLKTDDTLFLENASENRFRSPISTFNSIYKRFDIYKILIGYEHESGISDFYIKDIGAPKYEHNLIKYWCYKYGVFSRLSSHSLKDRENIQIHIFFSTPGMSEDILEKYIADDKNRFGGDNLFNMKRYDKNDEIILTYNKKLNKESHDSVREWDIYLNASYENNIITCAAAHYSSDRSLNTFSGPKQKSMYEIDITRGIIYKK
jgi:hypothetical protein